MSDLKRFKQIINKMYDTFKEKRNDYGDSTRFTCERFGPVSYLVRMYDKMSRLETLLVKGKERKVDERIEDTLMDLANYAIIAAIELIEVSPLGATISPEDVEKK